MTEDLKELWRHVDLHAIFQPASGEQFMMNLVFLALVAGCIVGAWKLIQRVLGG